MYALRRWFTTLSPEQKKYIKIVDYTLVNNVNELLAKEAEYLAAGHEGLMVRKLDGRYKCGRSSLKEGILLKFKRFVDAEAEVIGVEERMHNDNVAEKDNFGRTKRSQDQDGMTPAGDLGALVVRDILTEVEFCIGSGFDAATRIQLWKEKGSLPGKIVKYRYFPTGVKDKPRFPTFLGFRDEEDM
jgi:DNA ligase-1